MIPADIVPKIPPVNGLDLDALAATVRAGLSEIQNSTRNALRVALRTGDALNIAHELVAAKTGTPGAWGRWLRENCYLSVRTAQLYAQLANHRDEIEVEIGRVQDLSLRAARRLVAPPKAKASKPKQSLPDLLTAWRAASKAERTTALSAIPIEEFYAAMPADWRAQMTARVVTKPRSADEPFIKASEILRRALSLLKVANPASPEVANAEREALAALRRLNVVLAGAGIDEITVVKQHAKEHRRAA